MQELLQSAAQIPLVTVVCLCYRQAAFLLDALHSVEAQTYRNIELIIADDHSQDGSAEIIADYQTKNPTIKVILSPKNIGNCALFNQALTIANGKYIIDLAADDVMLPERVALQVNKMEKMGEKYGICYSDAYWTDEKLRITHTQYKRNAAGNLKAKLPEGNVYQTVIANSFICPPTVMYRTAALREIGGYDESLTYEDFDSWVRIARNYFFTYCPEPLMLKRVVPYSLSTYFYKRKKQQYALSTLKICQKIAAMNQKESEQTALAIRVRFELRQAFFTENYDIVFSYFNLLKSIQKTDTISYFFRQLAFLRLPIYPLYALYKKGQIWFKKRLS
jgi:glycosyltransferase involved in cell wall biosynthesis